MSRSITIHNSEHLRSKPADFAEALAVCQYVYASQRTCQILVNALGADPFSIEDDEAVTLLYDYAGKATS